MADTDAEARAFLVARELIAEHGDGVAAFIATQIRQVMETPIEEQGVENVLTWFAIRNAVGITLGGSVSKH